MKHVVESFTVVIKCGIDLTVSIVNSIGSIIIEIMIDERFESQHEKYLFF